ncbi:phage tail tape measure protein, partial [Streptococcus danieliae]|nr:phage tail tape measure protein [Streptococcus danieliae]
GARSQRGAFNSAGSFIADGLSAGINAMSGNVMGVAASLASKAASAIKAALKIHSPSRVTKEFGMYFGLGFINGISGMEAKTKKTA